MKFEIKNLSVFNSRMKKRVHDNTLKVSKATMLRALDIVRSDIVKEINRGAKTGETYQLYNPTRTHRASAPGEFPATDTGFLVSNKSTDMKVEQRDGGNDHIVGEIISSAPYAKHLEFGTRNMRARPYMQPGLARNAKKIEALFKRKEYIK